MSSRSVRLLIGPLAFIFCCLLIPESLFVTFESRAAVGTIVWMALWWVTAPVDYAVTAFLPIAINAVINMADMSKVIANYSSETILLLLGASILSVSWEETGLDKRIAVRFLSFVGNNFRKQLIFWFLLSEGLSSVLPNAVVCATITPIAISMLRYVGEGNIKESKKGAKLLLAIVYATGIGGLASPLGGAMNLVTIDYLQKLTGSEYIYISWVIHFFPIMIILTMLTLGFVLRNVPQNDNLPKSKDFFQGECKKLTSMTKEEKMAFAVFIIAIILSFTRQFYKSILPGLKPAYVFIVCAILSFIITGEGGKRLMVWKSVQTKIVWELIYIFAGGLAGGTLINESGAADAIGKAIANIGKAGGFLTIFAILTITILLSDVTSNTATAAVVIPIVISVFSGIGENAIPYIYIASIGVNISYMLPTSIRAIPVGYGLQPSYMFKEGWKITVIVIIVVAICSYALLKWWPMFSII